MSLDITSLNLVQTIDPRLDIQKLSKLLYGVESVGTDNLFRVFPLTNANTSNFTVTANPSNNRVFVDRKVYLQMQFELNFVGVSGGAGIPLLQCPGLPTQAPLSNYPNAAYYDAPRAYGLSNTLNDIAVSLNGSKINTNLQQYIRALTRYSNNIECQDQKLGYSPTMLDQSQEYSQLDGFNRNPLAGYGDNVYQTPRGGFINAVVTVNTATGVADTAQVILTLMEPIYLSPLSNACDRDEPGFIQLNTLSVSGTFSGRGTNIQGLASTLWSHSSLSPSTFSAFGQRIISNNCNLIYLEIQPPLDMIIPQTIVYDYVEPYYVQTVKTGGITAGTTVVGLSLDNIQLTSVPERVYIWVDEQDPDYDWTNTDTFFGIQQINITFNTKSGILSTATPEMLYNISVRNRTNSNYRQFINDVGSVLCLRFGEDIPLNNLVAPGSRGSYNFTANLSVKNNSSRTIVPAINLLFMYSGTFAISNGRCFKNIGLLTEGDVLNTKQTNELPMPASPPYNALGTGGSLAGGISWSDFTSFFKKLGRAGINAAQKVVPILAPEFTPVVTAADVLARRAGFGKSVGGKKLTRKEMLKMLR